MRRFSVGITILLVVVSGAILWGKALTNKRHYKQNAIGSMDQIVVKAIAQVNSTKARQIHMTKFITKPIDKNGYRLTFLWPSEWQLMMGPPSKPSMGLPGNGPNSPFAPPQGAINNGIPAMGPMSALNAQIIAIGASKENTAPSAPPRIRYRSEFMEEIGGHYALGKQRLWGRWSLMIMSTPIPNRNVKNQKNTVIRESSTSLGLNKTNILTIAIITPDHAKKVELTYRVDWWGPPNDTTPHHRMMPVFHNMKKRIIEACHFVNGNMKRPNKKR